MQAAMKIYREALERTARAFSLPSELVEAVADAYYSQKPLDAGAELVLAKYQAELSALVGPLVMAAADSAAKRDRAKHDDRNGGSGGRSESATKGGRNQKNKGKRPQCACG